MSILSRAMEESDHEAQAIDWEAAYLEYLPRVYNFFRYRLGERSIAEDLTAATFEKVWKARGRYRKDLSSVGTWLFSIARNVAIGHFRKHRQPISLEALELHSEKDAVEKDVQKRSDFARLHHLLSCLPARERELIALKYGAELTNRTIAQLTHLSESNVGTILYRVVGRLRAQWEEGD
ncbi:MAG: hypothetical protein A2Z14_04970 [Chloroflexi bacterium RBG_16_48_8]|nr:MAG: hypothetical protein A2Z14_04970 [Chloroflexi bacterium RBG_16_48_8]